MYKNKQNQNSSILIIVLFFISALSSIASDIYIAALPYMGRYFNASGSDMQRTLSLFFIGMAISQLVYGPLSDYIGRKKVLLFGFLLFAVGCLLCLLSKNIGMFFLGRFVQGCGAGATTCIARAIIRDIFEGKMLIKVLSYVGMGLAIVPAVSPAMGASIQYFMGWKMEFLFMFLFSLTLFFISMLIIPETNYYLLTERKSFKKIVMEYLNALVELNFFINVSIASFVISMIYIFYTITSFYLQNNLHWNSIQYSSITILIAFSLLVGRKLNIFLSQFFSNHIIILLSSILALISSIIMASFFLLKFDVIITLLVPSCLYAIAGGNIFSSSFVEATIKHKKTIGLVSSLYGFIQMSIVFILLFLSSLFNISTIPAIYKLIGIFSIISIFMIMFLISKTKK